MRLIDEEIARGDRGRIIIKANSITERDPDRQAQRGQLRRREGRSRHPRHLLPRAGACRGHTDNISVTSIVGRFLEHSRIYCFGEGELRRCYLSSADLMTRNQTRRVEVACPVHSQELKDALSEYLDRLLADNTKAWRLGSDGNYVELTPGDDPPQSVQAHYMDHPLELAHTQRPAPLPRAPACAALCAGKAGQGSRARSVR